MPNWKQMLDEVSQMGSTHDLIRRKYLQLLHQKTGRNVIVYYSGWLQKADLQRQGVSGFDINDADKSGFMAVLNGLDKTIGLDLILHTPGGDIAATESLVDYLRSLFNNDIRAIVPQLAMSCGTMIACACKEILMGKHSSLGAIDPQFGGIAAHGILEEFERASLEIQQNPALIPLWQMIIGKYNPTLVGQCQHAINWSTEMVTKWLKTGMFNGQADAEQKAETVVQALGSRVYTKNHARHISAEHAEQLGLKVVHLEDDPDLQEAVLSVHHACIHTLSDTSACKLIENQNGVAYVHEAKI